MSKVQEHTWKSEQEHETEVGIPKIQSTEDLNGELPIGPIGKRRMFSNESFTSKTSYGRRCGLMVIALDSRVRALAGDITLCSWGRYFTLTMPLSTQVYYSTGEFKCSG